MRRGVICGLALLSMIVVLSFTVFPSTAVAADYSKVGVKVGDTADYSVAITNSLVNHLSLNFTHVTGTVVMVNLTYYNPNETKNASYVYIANVSEGGIWEFLTAADLSNGDRICTDMITPSWYSTPWINETTAMFVAGASRTVNHVRTAGLLILNSYYDKPTGLMVKSISGLFGYWRNFTMTSTSLWGVGALPISTAALISIWAIAVVATIIVAPVILERRRSKKR